MVVEALKLVWLAPGTLRIARSFLSIPLRECIHSSLGMRLIRRPRDLALGEEGYPSAGRIAWALWGGDAGFSWSRRIANQINDDRSEEVITMDNEELEGVVVEEEVIERSAEEVEAVVEEVVEEAAEEAS